MKEKNKLYTGSDLIVAEAAKTAEAALAAQAKEDAALERQNTDRFTFVAGSGGAGKFDVVVVGLAPTVGYEFAFSVLRQCVEA